VCWIEPKGRKEGRKEGRIFNKTGTSYAYFALCFIPLLLAQEISEANSVLRKL
jgi:hypothetical protein